MYGFEPKTSPLVIIQPVLVHLCSADLVRTGEASPCRLVQASSVNHLRWLR